MKFDIHNRFTGAVQFTAEIDCDDNASTSIKLGLAVRWANLNRANLNRASLDGANLDGANLDGANLARAYLAGANLAGGEVAAGDRPPLQIGPIGSRSAYLIAWLTKNGVFIRAGCFWGSRDAFAAKVKETHGDNVHAQEYEAALVLIDAHARLWMPKEASDDEG